MPGIVAIIEIRENAVRRVSYEAVTAARSVADALGEEVHALAIGGPGSGEGAGEVAKYGADKIFVVETEALARYNSEGFAQVVSDFVREHRSRGVVLGASAMGKDLGPRVGARLGVGYASDCTALSVEGERIVATRPRYAGKVVSKVEFDREPAVLSVRPNVFTPREQAAGGEVVRLGAVVDPGSLRAIISEIRATASKKLDVGEASIIVSGGRGMRDPENFKLLEELADALGAAVGASRAVVDAGWRPHAEQVGQTGKTVAPQLYFAIGISGAIQHLAGMRTSRYIVAINKDPDAPIFKIADYGIVGDLFEIVPRLTEEVRKLRR
jgi:electron transfer flavoprotein alpha subunit